jgi:hypothetical protein
MKLCVEIQKNSVIEPWNEVDCSGAQLPMQVKSSEFLQRAEMAPQCPSAGNMHVEKVRLGGRPDTRHISIATATIQRLECKYRLLRLEEGLHQVDDAVFAIHHGQHAPLVEGEARMRDIEADHVSRAKTVLG